MPLHLNRFTQFYILQACDHCAGDYNVCLNGGQEPAQLLSKATNLFGLDCFNRFFKSMKWSIVTYL